MSLNLVNVSAFQATFSKHQTQTSSLCVKNFSMNHIKQEFRLADMETEKKLVRNKNFGGQFLEKNRLSRFFCRKSNSDEIRQKIRRRVFGGILGSRILVNKKLECLLLKSHFIGGGIAQRQLLRFSASSPGFESRLCRFSLLLSLWTAKEIDPIQCLFKRFCKCSKGLN